MRGALPVALALATAGALSAPLGAQAPTDEAPFHALEDSLGTITSQPLLDSMVQAQKAIADRRRDDPDQELRLGLMALRLGQVTGKGRDFNLASATFAGLVEDYPAFAMPWFGQALTDMEQSKGSVSFGFAKMFGLDPAKAIIADLVRSTGPDSSDYYGVLFVGHRALRTRDDLDQDVALRSLRLLPARAMARSAEVALVRARLEREHGEKDSAIAVIERAARLHPDDALVLRAQAQMRFVVGRSDGAGPWYRGLTRARGEAFARYRRDLEVALPDSVLTVLDTIRPADRDTLIQAYWASQDPDGLPTAADRLAEHYRRLEFARHHYVRVTVRAAHPTYELDTLGADVFDARGETLLRHGSPDERTAIGWTDGPDVKVSLHIIGMPPNESWVYHYTHEGERFYHFYAPSKDSDFVAATSILDLLAHSEQYKRFRKGDDPSLGTTKTWGAELVSAVAQDLMRSRQDLSPLYSEMINQGMKGADSLQRLEREQSDPSTAAPYSYELGFELPMHASLDALAVGSDRRGPVVQVAFAVPGGDVIPERLRTGAMAYPLRMRVAVVDQRGITVRQVDTVRTFVAPRRLANNQYLLGQLPLRLPPGTYRVRATLESGRRGTLSPPTLVHVPAPGGSTLQLSDVSLGARSVPITWNPTARDTAWTNPLRRFTTDEPMRLYVEASGLASGTIYRATVAIDRLEALPENGTTCDGGGGSSLSLTTSATAGGGVERLNRAIALDRLKPGEYRLAITVAADGEQATRCRNFTVAKP